MRKHIELLAVCLVLSILFAGCTANPKTLTRSTNQEDETSYTVQSPTRSEANTVAGTVATAAADIGHKHTFVKADTVPPTCEEGGYTWYVCTCGEKEKRDMTDKLAHSWGKWQQTAEPTCAREGVKTRSCTVCGAQQSKTIGKTEHDYVFIQTIAPTSYSEGYDLYRCAGCQATEKRNVTPKLEVELSVKEARKAANNYVKAAGAEYDKELDSGNSSYGPPVIWKGDELKGQRDLNQKAVDAVKAVMEKLRKEDFSSDASQYKMRCYIKYFQEDDVYWIYVYYAKSS